MFSHEHVWHDQTSSKNFPNHPKAIFTWLNRFHNHLPSPISWKDKPFVLLPKKIIVLNVIRRTKSFQRDDAINRAHVFETMLEKCNQIMNVKGHKGANFDMVWLNFSPFISSIRPSPFSLKRWYRNILFTTSAIAKDVELGMRKTFSTITCSSH